MSEPEPRRSRATTWALSVVVLLLLYVLSIGPVAYWAAGSELRVSGLSKQDVLDTRMDRSFLFPISAGPTLDSSPKLIRIVYGPVQWLHDQTPLAFPLDGYIAWWIRLAI